MIITIKLANFGFVLGLSLGKVFSRGQINIRHYYVAINWLK